MALRRRSAKRSARLRQRSGALPHSLSGAPLSDSGAERSLTSLGAIHVKVKEAPAPSAMPSWEVERWQRTLAAYRAEHDPSTVVPHMQTRDMGEPVEVREAKG